MSIRCLILLILLLANNLIADDIRFQTFLPNPIIILDDGKILPKDNYVGDINAPLIMIEYGSFSCTHCATFSKKIFPLIKEKYIDTGKLLFIFKDFPLDEAALKGAILAQCYGENGNYFAMYHALFDSLEYWISGSDIISNLKEVAKIGKMNLEKFDRCMQDKEIRSQILNRKIYAIRNLNIQTTPIFIINGEKYKGIRNFHFFSNILDDMINASKRD